MLALLATPQDAPATQGVTLALFVLYLAATVAIGVWAARRNEDTQEGYFLAGRGLSPFVVALSAVSSGRSAWLVLGASGMAFTVGLSSVWVFPGYVLAEFVLLYVLGRRLRERSAEAGAITVPEVLGALALGPDGRPGSSRLPLRPVAGLVVVVFLMTYVSAQLSAGGKALEAIFPGVDGDTTGLLLTAGIVLVYTLLGGYRAVALTDVLQALFMVFGLLVLPLIGLVHVGGVDGLRARLAEIDPELLRWVVSWKALLAGVAIGLGSFGSPPILVRAMSIARPGGLRRAALIGTTWNVLMALGAWGIGLVGRAVYGSVQALPGGDSEHVYPALGALLSQEYLFAGFVGVLLAALFAAIMSTCDSQLLVVASSFVRDLRPRPAAGGGHGLASSRLAVLLTLLAAVAIQYGASKEVYDFVLVSWDALGAAFGPAVLFLLLRPAGVRAGPLLASMLVGVATTMGWGARQELAGLVHQRIVGFAAACVVLALGSRAVRRAR